MTCTAPGCERPAACKELCWAHYKRAARLATGESELPLAAPFREYGAAPADNLRRVASAYAKANDEDDDRFRLLDKLLRVYALALRRPRKIVQKRTQAPNNGQGRAPRGR